MDCGGGVYAVDSDVSITESDFTGNQAIQGGGLCLVDSYGSIDYSNVSGNSAWHGGGFWIENSPSVGIKGNVISANSANTGDGGHGGGLYLRSSNVTLVQSVIVGNGATYGGGAFFYQSDPLLLNNALGDNHVTTAGAGLYATDSSPVLRHNTIVGNTGGDGSGIHFTDSGGGNPAVEMTNTILAHQLVGIHAGDGNSVVVDGILWYQVGMPTSQTGTGSIVVTNEHSGDPAFAADGYHITSGSAAQDAGVATDVVVDIDGSSRPVGAFDLGADELGN